MASSSAFREIAHLQFGVANSTLGAERLQSGSVCAGATFGRSTYAGR
jgi:hypothetical protein